MENTPDRLAHKLAALQRKLELASADEIDFSRVESIKVIIMHRKSIYM